MITHLYNSSNNKASENDDLKALLGGENGEVQVARAGYKVESITTEGGINRAVVKEKTINVTPIRDNGQEIHGKISTPITFELPVIDESNHYAYANVYHEGNFIRQIKIEGEGADRFIKVSHDEFSTYSYELTNEKYAPTNPSKPNTGWNDSWWIGYIPNTATR